MEKSPGKSTTQIRNDHAYADEMENICLTPKVIRSTSEDSMVSVGNNGNTDSLDVNRKTVSTFQSKQLAIGGVSLNVNGRKVFVKNIRQAPMMSTSTIQTRLRTALFEGGSNVVGSPLPMFPTLHPTETPSNEQERPISDVSYLDALIDDRKKNIKNRVEVARLDKIIERIIERERLAQMMADNSSKIATSIDILNKNHSEMIGMNKELIKMQQQLIDEFIMSSGNEKMSKQN